MASCHRCGDSQSLRYTEAGWVCFDGCGNLPSSKPTRPSPKKLSWKRSPLFEPWVLVDGVRQKLRHTELREAYRLWAAHKDIREGKFP